MIEGAAENEGALRLRALVRIVLSPAIWAIILLQALVQFIGATAPAAEDDAAAALLRTLVGASAIIAMLYAQAGVLASLARSRGPVSIADMLREGRTVFLAFVWLIVRAALVLAGIGVAAGVFAIGLTGAGDPQVLAARLAPFFVVSAILLPFVFVYWLPHVFVHGDFRLFGTLREALILLWQRRAQSGYLVLLIVLPGIVAGLLPAATPLAIRLALGGAIMLLAWAANTYCIEWMLSHRTRGAPQVS